MPNYRWNNPQEWLDELIAKSDGHELRSIAYALASKLDNDTVQDLFQSEMSDDGYFRPETNRDRTA